MKGSYYLARVFIILLRVLIILARVVISCLCQPGLRLKVHRAVALCADGETQPPNGYFCAYTSTVL